MKNTAVINGILLKSPAFRPLVDGRSTFQRSLAYAQALPEVAEPLILLSRAAELPAGVRALIRETWTDGDIISAISSAVEGCESAFYFHADCPFLDLPLTRTMLENHRRYWADYTFADGYPYGIAPEILTRGTIDRLRSLVAAENASPGRDLIFTLIRKDINSFDIETEISPSDMRLMRLSLTADTERNFLLLSRVVEAGGREAQGVCGILRDHQVIHRTLPAFYPIQIVERCPYACAYCPYPVFGGDVVSKSGHMPVEKFAGLVRKIAAFSKDATIDISLWGDPGLHPRIFDIVEAALAEPGIDLLIETSGVGWTPGTFARIRSALSRQPTWIVSLDAATEVIYRTLRGPGFAEAQKSAEELLALFPGRAHVQAVRMKENEEDLEVFFKTWKARTENVIVQKYDSFIAALPDRQVADLSPLKRFPCWHLKRDMAILMDGTVPLCREDVRAGTRLGNAFDEELAVIWDRAQDVHRAHVSGEYPGICAGCDEYYTFNF
jgi:spiro-SPASM protein